MNERIRELMYQAANGMISYDAEGDWRLSGKEVEKFAELIIQECIKLSQPQVEYPLDGTWIEKSYWEGCYDSSKRIEDHFGFKE